MAAKMFTPKSWAFFVLSGALGLLVLGVVSIGPADARPELGGPVASRSASPARCSTLSFGPQQGYSIPGGPGALVTGDFNNDNKPDFAVAQSMSNTVAVLLGNGDNTFQPLVSFEVGYQPTALDVGDFNGDDHLDIV